MDSDDLLDSDRAILDALAEGRATPGLLADLTGLAKQTVHTRLNVLVASGHVDKVDSRGLYELVDDPREGAAGELVFSDPVTVPGRFLVDHASGDLLVDVDGNQILVDPELVEPADQDNDT